MLLQFCGFRSMKNRGKVTVGRRRAVLLTRHVATQFLLFLALLSLGQLRMLRLLAPLVPVLAILSQGSLRDSVP